MTSQPVSRAGVPWQLEFLLLSAIWGLSFYFIKLADGSFSPILVAFGRVVLGAGALLAVLAIRRERLPRSRALWLRLAVAALLSNVLPFALFAYGELQVTSVAAGIWNSTTPLMTMALALAVLREDRPSAARCIGLVVGFGGVLLVLAGGTLAPGDLLGNLACFSASALYAGGFVYARRFVSGSSESAIALSAAQLLLGALWFLPVLPLLATVPRSVSPGAVAALVALGAAGTGLAYVLNYRVLRAAGPTVASTVTYVIPIVATVAGVVLLGEHWSWNQPAGAVLIIGGVVFAQRAPVLRRSRPAIDPPGRPAAGHRGENSGT